MNYNSVMTQQTISLLVIIGIVLLSSPLAFLRAKAVHRANTKKGIHKRKFRWRDIFWDLP